VLEDGAIIEMRIWRVPAAVPPSPHEFKYSLFYGRPGEVVVCSTTSAANAITGISARSKSAIGSKVQSG
jgi:hypothetical protein